MKDCEMRENIFFYGRKIEGYMKKAYINYNCDFSPCLLKNEIFYPHCETHHDHLVYIL